MSDIHYRHFRMSDLEQVTEILNPFITGTAVTFDTEPYQPEQRIPWAKQFNQTGRHQCFVAVNADGTVIGYANSGPLRPKRAYDTSIEVSVYCADNCQTRGVGTQLYQTLFKALEKEDVHRAHALVTLPNDASVALHTKLGFYEVGTLDEAGRKFGHYHSVYWMEKRF